MTTASLPLVRLVWIEVVGHAAADIAAELGERWERALGGEAALELHLEANGRRLLLLERWARPAALDTWLSSEARDELVAWLDALGARSAASRWLPTGEGLRS